MPIVSVVIPTRDRAEVLRIAVSSVLAQTFRDLEIVVVDDASRDATAEILRGFCDARLRVLRQPEPRGASVARNLGIRHAGTPYVAFLDDDDEWLPEKLEAQVRLLDHASPEVGLVYTGYLVLERSSGRVTTQMVPSKDGDLSRALMVGNCLGGTSSVLIRRQCLDEVGLFDEDLPSFQDYDLWIRIARRYRIAHVAKPLMKYYLHDHKISTNAEAVMRGAEMMIGKYGDSSSFRWMIARRYVTVAFDLLAAGDVRRGRSALRRAIRLSPVNPRAYYHLVRSFLRRKHLASSLPLSTTARKV